MRTSHSVLKLVTFPAFIVIALFGLPSIAETILTTQQAVGVSARNVQVMGPEVQGEIVNQTDATVVSAELLVSHHWLWADEMHPGTDDPGWVEIHPLNVSVPAGGSAPFRVQSSRIAPQRSDGTFETRVFVHRFETIPSQ